MPDAAARSPGAAASTVAQSPPINARSSASVDADMIVVGNKRVQGAARILGSIASEVARKAQCDLHIVYTHAR